MKLLHRTHYFNLHLSNLTDYMKVILEAAPFYSQCFLMLGMAFERWMKVCRPHNAKQILSQTNLTILYSLVLSAAIFVPVATLSDYVANVEPVCHHICFIIKRHIAYRQKFDPKKYLVISCRVYCSRYEILLRSKFYYFRRICIIRSIVKHQKNFLIMTIFVENV